MRGRIALALAVALTQAPRLGAQGVDARLAGRLDSSTAAAVTALADSARAAGLPATALVNKALEGASKGASDERIVAAVRDLGHNLAAARAALGPVAGDAELVAGAAALRAGVDPTWIAGLKRTEPRANLLVPLAVMADLVARGVPADTAAAAVLALAGSGARTSDLVAFRENVERDIALGAAAGASAATRALTATGAPASPGGQGTASTPPPPRKP